MTGLRKTTIAKQLQDTNQAYQFRKPKREKSVYIQLRPSTPRYQKLMAVAERLNISYHRLALEALDWYLATQAPKDV